MGRLSLAGAVFLCLATFPLFAADDDDEAVKVFSSVQRSVVALESVASRGTGLLLDDAGTILTNAHVVAMPLRFKCKVDVPQGEDSKTVVFQKVKVIGFHPTLDLAIVKIDPLEHGAKLAPAVLSKEKVLTGQRVYAIGNPGADKNVNLTKTITSGLLSGVDRVIEDVSYLQISAPINPGNSGGPLCDKRGNVIGLVTLKMTNLENVGFAIPLKNFKLEEFRPLAERTGDPEKATKLLVFSNQVMEKIRELERTKKNDAFLKILRMIGVQVLHEALLAAPDNPSIYCSIAEHIAKLGDPAIAEEYFLLAFEVDPWGGSDERLFLTYAAFLREQMREEDAFILLREGAAKLPMTAAIWHELAEASLRKKNWYQTALATRLVLRLDSQGDRFNKANQRWTSLAPLVTDPTEQARILDMMSERRDAERRIMRRNQLLVLRATSLTPEFAAYMAQKEHPLDAARVKSASLLKFGSAEGNPIDVLPRLDLAHPVESEAWTSEGQQVLSPKGAFARISAFPEFPPEYELQLELERKAGTQEFVIGLPWRGAQLFIALDQGGTSSAFIGQGAAYAKPILPIGQSASVVVKVRQAAVSVWSNDQELFRTSGTTPPPVPEKWKGAENATLTLGAQDSAFKISGIWMSPFQLSPYPVSVGGKLAASSSGDLAGPSKSSGPIKLVEQAQFSLTSGSVASLAPGGRWLAAGGEDRSVLLFDLRGKKETSRILELEKVGKVSSVGFASRGDVLLAGGDAGLILVWKIGSDGTLAPLRKLAGHKAAIKLLAVAPDGTRALSVDQSEHGLYWHLDGAKEPLEMHLPAGLKTITIVPQGREALASDGEHLYRIDLAAGELKGTLKLPSGNRSATAVAISADGSFIAEPLPEGVIIWNSTGTEVARLKTGSTPVSVAFVPDTEWLAVGGAGECSLWDIATRERRHSWKTQGADAVRALVVGSDGRTLATVPASSAPLLQVFGRSGS